MLKYFIRRAHGRRGFIAPRVVIAIPSGITPVEKRAVLDSAERAGAYVASGKRSSQQMVFRISGAFFFGAASTVAAVLDRIAEWPKVFVFDFSAVPILDSTGARVIHGFAKKLRRHGTTLVIAGAIRPVRHELWTHGVRPPLVRYKRKVDDAVSGPAP